MNTHVQIYIRKGRGKRIKDRERGERKGSRRKEKGKRKQLEGKVSGVRPEDAHVNTVY